MTVVVARWSKYYLLTRWRHVVIVIVSAYCAAADECERRLELNGTATRWADIVVIVVDARGALANKRDRCIKLTVVGTLWAHVVASSADLRAWFLVR